MHLELGISALVLILNAFLPSHITVCLFFHLIKTKFIGYLIGRFSSKLGFDMCFCNFYFIVSGEISVYLMKIKLVSITSEMISYHFTIVTDKIYIFTARFGRLRFSSLFQKWMLPPLQIDWFPHPIAQYFAYRTQETS